METKELYLNQADGRKEKKLENFKSKNPKSEYTKLQKSIRIILDIQDGDFLSFAQNATTNLIKSIKPILEKDEYEILISSHEIKWFQELFKIGKMPMKSVTYPNYAKLLPVNFIKKDIKVFEPNTLIDNPEKLINPNKKYIIILSHVSRMTGELFATAKLYKFIKKLNKNNILVLDGSQSVGAIKCEPKKLSDIYIGVTYKFINAEPHISFCYINKNLTNKYSIQEWGIDPVLFEREIYSAIQAIKESNKKSHDVSEIRKYFDKKMKECNIPIFNLKNQAQHIALVPINDPRLSKIIKQLKAKGIIVSSNIKLSITEPKVSAIRISLTPKLTHKEIDYFVETISQL